MRNDVKGMKVLKTLFLVLGMVLSVIPVMGEGDNTDSTLTGTMVNAVSGQPVYDITLPQGYVLSSSSNYVFGFQSVSDQSVTTSSSLNTGRMSSELFDKQVFRINPGLVNFPDEGIYKVSLTIDNGTPISLRNSEGNESIEIIKVDNENNSNGQGQGQGNGNSTQNSTDIAIPDSVTFSNLAYIKESYSVGFDIGYDKSDNSAAFLNAIGLANPSTSGPFSFSGTIVAAQGPGPLILQGNEITAENYPNSNKVILSFSLENSWQKEVDTYIGLSVGGYAGRDAMILHSTDNRTDIDIPSGPQSGCIITPNNSDNTTSFTISCSDDTIKNLNMDSGYAFDFSPYGSTNGDVYSVKLFRNSEGNAIITQDTIIDECICLPKREYSVTMDIFDLSGDHQEINLTSSGSITCDTTGIVSDETNQITIVSDSDGIHFKGMSAAYIEQAISRSTGTDHNGNNGSYLQLDKGLSPNNTLYTITHDSGNTAFIQKEYVEGTLVGGLVPSSAIIANSIGKGTYQHLCLHVPGYKELILNGTQQNPDVIELVTGAPDAGTFWLSQVLTATEGEIYKDQYSFTISVKNPSDTSELTEEQKSQYQRLKGMNELFWSSEHSAHTGTGFSNVHWDDTNCEAVFPYEEAKRLYSMLEVGDENNVLTNLCISIPGYSPSPVKQVAENDNVTLYNPLHSKPEVLRSYILGTKLTITSSSEDYLKTFTLVGFYHSKDGNYSPDDFDISRDQQEFTWSAVTKQSDGYYQIELPLDINTLNHYRGKTTAINESVFVNIRNDNYQAVWNSLADDFNSMMYVDDSKKIAESTTDVAISDLKSIDSQLINGQFMHVDFEGGVFGDAKNKVDISGVFAGAVTEDDMDLIVDDNAISISTIVDNVDDTTLAALNDYALANGLGEINEQNAVNILIYKRYPEASQSNEITELEFKSAITFETDLPALKDGKSYVVITRHNGIIKKIPVQMFDGKPGIYTKEFSAFALVADGEDEVEEGVSEPVVTIPNDIPEEIKTSITAGLIGESAKSIIKTEDLLPSETFAKQLLDGVEVDSGYKAVVQTYLEISLKSASDDGSLVFEITPMVRVVKMPENELNSTKPDGKTILEVTDKTQVFTEFPKSVTMTIPVGTWADNGTKLYVTHTKSEQGKKYVYSGIVSDGAVSVENPNGFSSFELTKGNPSVAETGGVGYFSLQEAVDKVTNGGTVSVTTTGAGSAAVISREVRFKLDGNATLKAGSGYEMTKEADGFYSFTAKSPAPSKESNSSSDKKSSTVKTGSVVTCQMAGYPADYAWNESAKACQPGYIDANGVFRSTGTAKRAGVPNTYDKGVTGSMVSFITATVFAAISAFILRNF